jgi:hypothetical protein
MENGSILPQTSREKLWRQKIKALFFSNFTNHFLIYDKVLKYLKKINFTTGQTKKNLAWWFAVN